MAISAHSEEGKAPASPFFRAFDGFTALAALAALIVAMPIIALLVMAFMGDLQSLGHIWDTVLFSASTTTILLLCGLAIFTGIIGAVSAWLVSFFDFPGRRIFAWALMLPLAVPTYISAYAFTEFFTFTGPVQSLLRQIGGFQSARDYWFPDIRSLGGAIFVLSLVLYPYVFMAVRALFFVQGRAAVEAAHVLGANHRRTLTQVLLPLARPALELGIILAMMEAINDIGAMDFLGVRTLTFTIFSTWVNQGDMAGSAQLALILLAVVLVLIIGERMARRGQKFADQRAGGTGDSLQRPRLKGLGALGAILACGLPVGLGFGVPFFTLGTYALRYIGEGIDPRLGNAFMTSATLALIAAVIATLLALFLSYAVRVKGGALINSLTRISALGYAMPGTIIALGIFLPLAQVDNFVDAQMRNWFDMSTGLLITGSGATLVYAYVIRFMAVAEGSIDGGFKKLAPSLDQAAYCYGRNRWQILTQVLLPLSKPAIATAALLVFIDSLKELSATLMLRPFGVETLSIYVHDLASRGRIEQAGFAALIIMAAGIAPVILLSHTMLHDRYARH